MTPDLTPQDKLAMALTSAGSERALAAVLGISARTLGRWLREGEVHEIMDEDTGEIKQRRVGVKEIPHEAHRAINNVFAIHKEITKAQARSDGIPYFEHAPLYAYRPLLNKRDAKGRQMRGERLVVPRTEYINRDMRMLYLAYAHNSGKFWGVSIRSVIDWYRYIVDQKNTTQDNYMALNDGNVMHVPTGAIFEQTIKPIYTKSEDFRKGSPGMRAIKSVEAKLAEKHSRVAVRFADEYLLQMTPEDSSYDAATSKARKKARGNRGPVRNRKRGK